MSRRNIFEKQNSDISKQSLQRQSTTKNLKGQKSFFSNFSKTLFKGGQTNVEDEEISPFGKGQENCIRVLIYLLINYDGMEEYLKRQSMLSPLGSYTPITKQFEDLSPIRSELIYYFQIISIRDFHDFYVDFYAAFDKNKNFSLEPSEFKEMLEMAVTKFVGPKKFKIITDMCLSEPSMYDNQLDPKIMAEMIDSFRDLEKEQKIDYLLLFPYIISFFLEFTFSQIRYRQGRLDLMRGTEVIKGKEVEIKNITSIVTILREMGIEYLKDKRTVCLTYRDVENLLIKLKNIHKWITYDIIKQIINQLAKLMQVDPKTQNEGKPLKLHKIVNFLALKLCIHQNCLQISKQDKGKQKPPSAYLEILVLWNAAMFGPIMKQASLNSQFQKFLDKHYKDQDQFLRPDAQKVLEHFFKKKFQLMPKDQIKSVLEQHPDFKGRKIIQAPISKDSLREKLFEMMCKDGYRKLKEYIRISYEGVNKSNSARIEQYQRQGKDFYEENNFINSPPSSENKQKSPQFDYQSEKIKKNAQIHQKKESSDSESQDSEIDKRKKPKEKLKRAVRVINSEIAFAQKAESKKDVLKACLIMDSFLKRQNQMYQKQQQSKLNLQNSNINLENDEQQILIQMDNNQMQMLEENIQLGGTPEIQQERKESRKKPEEKKKQVEDAEQDGENGESKKLKLVPQRQKIVIKDIKHSPKLSSDLFMVAGKEGKNYGPSNFKNAYYQNNGNEQQVAKLMNFGSGNKSQLFQLTDDNFKDEEGQFQVVIDDVQLQTQILIQQNIAKSKKPKDRSTCYYCSIQ